jgi:hypothetical protein
LPAMDREAVSETCQAGACSSIAAL